MKTPHVLITPHSLTHLWMAPGIPNLMDQLRGVSDVPEGVLEGPVHLRNHLHMTGRNGRADCCELRLEDILQLQTKSLHLKSHELAVINKGQAGSKLTSG